MGMEYDFGSMQTKINVSPKAQSGIGFLLLAFGLIGILVSFTVQKSEIDPTAMMIALVSIAVSIVGISIILEAPHADNDRATRILSP
jgi:hypothetical protein